MKKTLLFCLSIAGYLTLSAQVVTITVNPTQTKQTIRGMGCQDDLETSVGGLKTNDDLLYDIGASSFRVFAGYKSDTYHWDEPVNDNSNANDLDLTKFMFIGANQTEIDHKILQLRKAAARGCTFYMTIGNPPCWMKDTTVKMYWMTHPGVPKNCEAGGILKADMYEEFGEFALGVTKKFKEDVGVDLFTITVNNEPEFTEPYYSCVYDKTQIVNASKAIAQKYKDNSIPTRIHFAEQTFVQGNVVPWATAANADALLDEYVIAYANHAYGGKDLYGGGVATPYQWGSILNVANATSYKKEIWMSEGGPAVGNTDPAIDNAIGGAQAFFNAMNYGNATLYSCRSLNKDQPPVYNSIKNYVRYIRPGSVRLTTSRSDTTAILPLVFTNDAKGGKMIYLANTSKDPKTIKINWSGISGKWDVMRTSEYLNCAWVGQVDLNDEITIPAKSISTFMQVTANKLPNIDMPDTIVILKGVASKTVNLTGINDGGETGQIISIKASTHAAMANLFSTITVNYTSPQTTGTITLVPKTSTGYTELSIAVSDKSTVLDSMYNEKIISVPVYIISFVNKAPTLEDIEDQNYSVAKIDAVQTLNLVGVTDGNDGSQKLTLSVSQSVAGVANITTVGSKTLNITPKKEGTTIVTVNIKDDGLTVGGGVNSISKQFKIVVGSGINSLTEMTDAVGLYPNPAKDFITINHLRGMGVIKIVDVTGRIYLSKNYSGETASIELKNIPKGHYLVEITNDTQTLIKQLIIE